MDRRNHDPVSPTIAAAGCDELEVGGIVLATRRCAANRVPKCRPFTPKLRLQVQGRRVSRRCFVASAPKLILPAFGSLTGGLDATHPEILDHVGSDAAALVPVSDRLLRFPLAA